MQKGFKKVVVGGGGEEWGYPTIANNLKI